MTSVNGLKDARRCPWQESMWVVAVQNAGIVGLSGSAVATIALLVSSWFAVCDADSYSRAVQLFLGGANTHVLILLGLSWLVGGVLSVVVLWVYGSFSRAHPESENPLYKRQLWVLAIHVLGWVINLLWWLQGAAEPVWPQDWGHMGPIINSSLGILNRLDAICLVINAVGLWVIVEGTVAHAGQTSTMSLWFSSLVQTLLAGIVVTALAKLYSYGTLFFGDVSYVFLEWKQFCAGIGRVIVALVPTIMVALWRWDEKISWEAQGQPFE